MSSYNNCNRDVLRYNCNRVSRQFNIVNKIISTWGIIICISCLRSDTLIQFVVCSNLKILFSSA